MSFRSKILLVLVAMGVLPILLVGWSSYRFSRDELVATINRLQTQSAVELARSAERFVDDGLQALSLAATYIPMEELSADELGAVLSIPYRQLPHLSVVVVLDTAGNALADPVYTPTRAEQPDAQGRIAISAEDLQAFSRHVPLKQALEHGRAIGPPFTMGAGTQVTLAVRAGRDGDRVLAAALSLDSLRLATERLAVGGGLAYIADATARPVVSSQTIELGTQERDFFTQGLSEKKSSVRSVARAASGEWFAAFAPVTSLGWGVVVAQPAADALRGPERVRTLSTFWAAVALVLTALLGIFLSRSFYSPVSSLSEAAAALTKARYDYRIKIDSRDEMGQLAEAFNHMAEEIERRNAEIQGWNEELQQRVEERTEELREAQEQILRTRRLTALGSMSAGVVHEINNPMTGLLGLVQLAARQLEAESAPASMLGKAMVQGKRVTRILEAFKQFAEQEQDAAGKRFSMVTLASTTVELVSAQLEDKGIELRADIAAETPEIIGHSAQIGQMLGNLLQNAIDALAEGGVITLRVRPVGDEAVKLQVQDDGPGIPEEIRERVFDPFYSTKQQVTQIGMGLTLCHKIVEWHHGRITIESEPGAGTTVEVYLPAAPKGAHLV